MKINQKNPCLGPYTIQVSGLLSEKWNVFIDNNKTKYISILSECDTPHEKPSINAVLLHESLNCPNQCDIRWYEIPEEYGRKYYLLITGCEILITNFEDGLLTIGNCDASLYGSSKFLFGKIYTGGSVFDNSDQCTSRFDFDGHTFIVTGFKSDSSALYQCENDNVSLFGSLPTIPTDIEPESVIATTEDIAKVVETESTITWINKPSSETNETGLGTVGLDLSMNAESAVSATDDAKVPCSSQDSPSVTTLSSGHILISYVSRDESGKTKISVALINSTVGNEIVYYRSMSSGTLLNDDEIYQNGGTFEVFDDIYLGVNANGIPPILLNLSFLNGPLSGGQPFVINSVTRDASTDRVKHIIKFNTNNRNPIFADSNNASNISWFISKNTSGFPANVSILEIGYHFYQGKECPVAHPSIAVADNALMIGSDKHIFLSYQAFEQGFWNVYARHLVLSENTVSNPIYELPYVPNAPISVLEATDSETFIYTVSDLISSINTICVLFSVSTTDGKPVYNCNQTTGTTTTSCGFEIDQTLVFAAAIFSKSLCGSVSTPSWVIGNKFVVGLNPEPSDIGWDGNPACVTITKYPSSLEEWCETSPQCTQYFVADDPYCPQNTPYSSLMVTYKPEDLWLLKHNDRTITRIKYHMSTELSQNLESDKIDFMFVIDYSGSMVFYINKIRQNLNVLIQNFVRDGVDTRFGLTIFSKSATDTLNIDPSAYPCVGGDPRCGTDSVVYNGLWNSNNADGGFTRDVATLNAAMSVPVDGGNPELGYSAILFALNDPSIVWRNNVKKIIALITDTSDSLGTGCGPYVNDSTTCATQLSNDQVGLILIIDQISFNRTCSGNGLGYLNNLGPSASPLYQTLDIRSPSYSVLFNTITKDVSKSTNKLRILERDISGYGRTFLKNAEVLITYDGDLSNYWTFDKNSLVFDDVAPVTDGQHNGLSSFPFTIYEQSVYGIPPVHPLGNTDNWVFFGSPGDIISSYPYIGSISSTRTSPILIGPKSTRSRICVNNRNDVFVVYENYELGYPEIQIKGTGDFSQKSITGPKSRRITKLLEEDNFQFYHEITSDGEGVNQLADIFIDNSDVVHIVWQSNRDSYWEIYYANGYDMFSPVRITNFASKSSNPKIKIDKNGIIYVLYHDNRFDNYQIFMSLKNEQRVLPLLEQDAYMASLRSRYNHYTNKIHIFLHNPVSYKPSPGRLFATKISSVAGNENNYIFGIDSLGNITGGGTPNYQIIALASSSDGNFYGITLDNKLLLLKKPTQDGALDVNVDEITEIGDINITAPDDATIFFSDGFSGTNGALLDGTKWIKVSGNTAIQCGGFFTICSCSATTSCGAARSTMYVIKNPIDTSNISVSIDTRYIASSPVAATGLGFGIVLRGNPDTISGVSPTYYLLQLTHVAQSPASYSDNFNRANGGLGANWLIVSSFSPVISSSECVINNNIGIVLYKQSLSNSTSHTVSIQGKYTGVNTNGTNATIRIICRANQTGTSGYAVSFVVAYEFLATNKITINRIAPSLSPPFAQINMTLPIITSLYKTYSVTCSQTSDGKPNINVYINGELVASVIDEYEHINGTYTGFGMYALGGSIQTYADNFTASDSFSTIGSTNISINRVIDGTSSNIVSEQIDSVPLVNGTTIFNYKFSCLTTESSGVKFNIYRNNYFIYTITDNGASAIINNSANAFTYGISHSTLLSGSNHQFLYFDNFSVNTPPITLATSRIIDATCDPSNRLWLLLGEINNLGESNLKLLNIDTSNADILRTTDAIIEDISDLNGGVTCLQNGDFYLFSYENYQINVYKSAYPIIGTYSAIFDFTSICSDVGINIVAATSDENNDIFILSYDNYVYTFDQNNCAFASLFNLTILDSDPYHSDPYNPEPIIKSSGFGYLYSGRLDIIGESGYFHVMLEFYNNINEHGIPIKIDSRKNLESFIVETDTDPYTNDLIFSPNGVYLNTGDSGFITFNAAHFRPEQNELAFPYGFETNKTYFPKAYLINSNSKLINMVESQLSSFSCSKCTIYGSDIFDSDGCSYSFVYSNTSDVNGYFNLLVDFYSDLDYQYLIRRYVIQPLHSDLDFVEIDNNPANVATYSIDGFAINAQSAKFIQVYPNLDTSSGFICGLNYYVKVSLCNTADCLEAQQQTSTSDGSVYWTSKTGGLIVLYVNKSDKDGNGNSLIYSRSQSSALPLFFVVHPSKYIFILETYSSPYRISRIDINTGIADLSFQYNSSYQFVSSLLFFDIDINRNNLYFISADSNNNRRINKISYSGDDLTSVIQFPSYQVIFGIKVDEINRKIYYVLVDYSESYPRPYKIMRVGFDGQNPETFALLVGVSQNFLDMTIDKGYNYLYVLSSTSVGSQITQSIHKWPTNGTPISSLVHEEITNDIVSISVDPANRKLYIGRLSVIQKLDLVTNTITSVKAASESGGGSQFGWAQVEQSLSTTTIAATSETLSNISGLISYDTQIFRCNCSSNVFDERVLPLSAIGRWYSSEFGYSDIRMTDTTNDCLRPSIAVRSTGGVIVLFEKKTELTSIMGATYFVSNLDQLFGSGSKNWFDYNFNINGQNTEIVLDLYDRLFSVYEKPDTVAGRGISKNEIKGNSLYYKAIDFDSQNLVESIESCDLSKFESNIITDDKFISQSIIKKIIVKPEYVEYYTYNTSKQVVPIVKTCGVTLQIFGTPEIVAIRLKNEDDEDYTSWCEFAPIVSDYYIEKNWSLSNDSGIKNVCVQAMTYSGITVLSCIPIIADYPQIAYEIKLYDSDSYNSLLPTSEGIFVAATTFDKSTGEAILQKTVYVEIIPSVQIIDEIVKYDVLQQGISDYKDLKATRSQDLVGRTVYRGSFDIKSDDSIFYKDGLAKIKPRFIGVCGTVTAEQNSFERDKFNEFNVAEDVFSDSLQDYRQASGNIGVTVVVNPSDDPYLIFGDQSFFTKVKTPTQIAIPLSGQQSSVSIGPTGPTGPTDNTPGTSGPSGSGDGGG